MSDENMPFLVLYDYGQGGVWWWIIARNPAEITEACPDVQVLERVPDWWTPEQDSTTPRINVDEPDATLRLLLNVR